MAKINERLFCRLLQGLEEIEMSTLNPAVDINHLKTELLVKKESLLHKQAEYLNECQQFEFFFEQVRRCVLGYSRRLKYAGKFQNQKALSSYPTEINTKTQQTATSQPKIMTDHTYNNHYL